MTEEKELIKKRGSFKGRLTAFINYLHTLTDEPLSLSDARELQLRMGKIESLYEQYDQVQLRLECIVDNSEEQFKERSDFESQYFKAIAKAQGLQNVNVETMSNMGSDGGTRASNNHKLVRLPTIQLPRFSGSYDDYLEFRDTFTSLIHNNDEIDEVNKFHYLRASLEGSAAVVIQSVEFSSSNYAVAWKLLCDRFDNKRLLIQNHVSSLFNVEAITKESSANLKRLIDQVNKNLRALESLGHFANLCKRPGCKICKRRHNTLIHAANDHHIRNENRVVSETTHLASSSTTAASDNVTLAANMSSYNKIQCDVLLSTALVKLYDKNNHEHIVRAILDSGSTSSLMTERLCRQLNLETCQVDKSIMGVNNATLRVGKTCHVHMTSLNNSFSSELQCYVLPSITSNVPGHEINISNIDIPTDISLADPTFFVPADVDILIGADLFWDLVGTRRIILGKKKPVLCETRLGWIISGPIFSHHDTIMHLNDIKCNFNKIDSSASHDLDDIRADLTRFWQLEEICSKSNYFPEERMCEEHFVANTTRLDDGRFCVRIPLKHDSSVLGNSFHRAEHCLFSLERRLTSNLELRDMYSNFMTEYKSLGHMSEYKQPEVDEKEYFIPHHGVMRDSSTSTKLRVVFNASSPTTSGVSYNDIQMIGPTVQDDLISILLRFRQHKYVLSADVEKMYRQIIVHPSDRHLQQILWRSNVAEPITKFILNTVTYGTSSAPFLATRCLKQLGIDCKDDKISEIIQHDFYVDDLLTGGNDLAEVQVIRKQVTNVLASACMPLRKWKSNNPMIDPQDVQASSFDLNIGSDEPNKLLGLSWHTDSDELCFPISSLVPNGNTKRDILSMIARIFDPLGLLAPCIINMKILLQQLWIKKLAWDEPLTDDINRHWNYIRKTLPLLNDLRVPRIVICDSCKSSELHVFSDASERAYGACIYLRSVSTSGEVMVRLLMAKSRVSY
ncbi:uncharacterized protein LOC131849430 [Achroia grisella]|uniref:uncharacterized protein LOC131849430 n=1 Tax=Achroia grisella TaxID=688607 RepID=UPI0027D25A77|nr:uncharacterized protein LOC131849430 [Achroia grisella]